MNADMKKRKNGFTIIELLVVVAIIGMVASVALALIGSSRAKSRDSRRLTDLNQIQVALELYHDSARRYPDGDGLGCSGWDTPGDGTFLTSLVNAGFLQGHIRDPLKNDNCGNYRYQRYPAGAEGCPAAFYVLGAVDMETSEGAYPNSPGWACPAPGGTNFQTQFDWVVGKYE